MGPSSSPSPRGDAGRRDGRAPVRLLVPAIVRRGMPYRLRALTSRVAQRLHTGYGSRKERKRARRDSNSRPTGSKCSSAPCEYEEIRTFHGHGRQKPAMCGQKSAPYLHQLPRGGQGQQRWSASSRKFVNGGGDCETICPDDGRRRDRGRAVRAFTRRNEKTDDGETPGAPTSEGCS